MIATRKSARGATMMRARNLRRGLGVTNEELGLEVCSGSSMDVGAQYACAQANDRKTYAYYCARGSAEDCAALGQSAPNTPQFIQGAQHIADLRQGANVAEERFRTGVVQTVAPLATAVTYSPRVSFTNSRGGSTLYPGDSWTIRITGAQPGSEVFVVGGKNGAQDRNRMGTTDASGTFTLTGAVSSAELGNWQETWTAGGLNAGSFSFSVVSGPGGSTASPQGPGSSAGSTSSSGATPPVVVTSSSSWFTDEMISGIPNWALLAAGAAALFLGGKR